jgi:ribosomal protein L30/L7E
MKKIAFIPLFMIMMVLAPGCNTLKNLGIIPSELEMALGLKDALSQGLFKGLNAFADPNGNPLVRFAFPGEAEKIEKTLRDLGFDKTINQVTGKFTKAMSSAVNVAKPLFFDAIKSMSIKDAAKILVTDNTHAATDYFKQSMKPGLMTAFRPIVDSTIKIEGADKEWGGITKIYNSIPFINKPLENSLTDFVSARVVDLMFVMVANEEEQIRTKYELRKTDLMKKVFTYAEQELKRRLQKQ